MVGREITLAESLRDLGIEASAFEGCQNRDEEFRVLAKHYKKQALRNHPDKGGTVEAMQKLNTAWALLRDLHTGKKSTRRGSEWTFSDAFIPKKKKTDKKANSRKKSKGNDTNVDEDEEAFDMSAYDFDWSTMEVPSWEWYKQAAEEEMPLYRVELAKSGRSKCNAPNGSKLKKCREGLAQFRGEKAAANCQDLVEVKGEPELIAKGEIRVGSLDEHSGGYGRWRHLRCWRIPAKIWKGFPDPNYCDDEEKFTIALKHMEENLLSGFVDLPRSDQRTFVDYCMNNTNWAKETKRKSENGLTIAWPEPPIPEAVAAMARNVKNSSSEDTPTKPSPAKSAPSKPKSSDEDTTTLAVRQEKFVTPKPGVNGASPATVLAGVTFVVTGVFPEIGGGSGLDLGKSKVKAMIQSFGGKVTSAISGKTNVLVVGKDPGQSKVTKARESEKCMLTNLKDLKEGLDQGLESLKDFPFTQHEEPFKIKAFSAGYFRGGEYNGKALTAAPKDYLFAQGLNPNEKTNAEKAASTFAALEGKKKSPAKKSTKRLALKDVKSDPNTSDDTVLAIEPAKKKRKKQKESTADKEGPKKTKAKATTYKKKKEPSPVTVEVDSDYGSYEVEDVIHCDRCASECTDESWFSAKKEEDYCPSCYQKDKEGLGDAILQRGGMTVD